jgi:hypothetical protein
MERTEEVNRKLKDVLYLSERGSKEGRDENRGPMR